MTHATLDNPVHKDATASAGALDAADLREIMEQYNAVTDRLQQSHVALQGEVTRLQRELASTNAQLQRSRRLSALGEMAAGIAHEIRNPLAAIRLYAEMVGADLEQTIVPLGGPDAVRETPLGMAAQNNRKIADAVQGLSGIVSGVLSFARQAEPCVRRLDAAALMRRVIDLHRPAIDAAEVEVVVKMQTCSVTADPDLLQQALVNLVRNAVDAMAGCEGARTLTVTVANGDTPDNPDNPDTSDNPGSPGRATITVADTGPGVADDEADRIFNPFFTTRSTGTGLGLAIVHRIVDAHGGSITMHNDAATGGAVFTVTLPGQSGVESPSTGADASQIQPKPGALRDSDSRFHTSPEAA